MHDPNPAQESGWRFQRVITPGGLLSLVVVLAGLLLWGGRIEGELHAVRSAQGVLQKTDDRHRDRIERQESRISDLATTAARIDERTASMSDQLDRIQSMVERKEK